MSPEVVASVRCLPMRRTFRGTLTTSLLLAAVAIWPAASAQADVGTQIIERCTHGQSIAGYTQQDYRKALEETTAEVNEYSPCLNLIHQAQLAAAGRHGSGTGGGAGVSGLTANVPPPTPAEQQALQTAHSTGSKPVSVGGQKVVPGVVVHANIASAVNALPTPLLALLAFLLVGALSILARGVRERVRTRRHR
jgi:hypothetical protein